MKRFWFLLIAVFILFCSDSAHPGRTDSNGGHYNRSTGEYHYHTAEPQYEKEIIQENPLKNKVIQKDSGATIPEEKIIKISEKEKNRQYSAFLRGIVWHITNKLFIFSSFVMCCFLAIFMLNVIFILILLFHVLTRRETISNLSFNIFSLCIVEGGLEQLTEEKLKQREVSASRLKFFIRFLFFSLFIFAFYHDSFSMLCKKSAYDLFGFFFACGYLLWSYISVCNANNPIWYEYPIILNPFARHRFYKRYKAFMKDVWLILRFEDMYDVFENELAYVIKSEWEWLSSKNIGGTDNYIENQLLVFLKALLQEGKVSREEAKRIADLIIHFNKEPATSKGKQNKMS